MSGLKTYRMQKLSVPRVNRFAFPLGDEKRDAAQGNINEVAAAKIAPGKAQSSEVKAFAQKMVEWFNQSTGSRSAKRRGAAD